MTLDVKKLLTNLLKKQMSIQHFSAKTKVFGVDVIPDRIKNKIYEEFGEQFLDDAKYVVFFRGDINKEGMEKLFNLTNKAFGEDANRLVEGDFKKISFVSGSQAQVEPEISPEDAEQDEVTDETPEDQDVEGTEDVEDVEDTEETSDDEEMSEPEAEASDLENDEDSEDDTIDKEVDEIVNEGSIKIDEDIQIDSSIDTYVFLKITVK